jgi:hypothetical protein
LGSERRGPALVFSGCHQTVKTHRRIPFRDAKRWQKDGSLLVEIETIQDCGGDGSTITANRTVVLGFDHSGNAKILKSTVKFAIENQ